MFDHLGKLKNLTHLLLVNTKIADASLGKVKNLPKLEHLGLAEGSSITAAGVAKLRAALPKLKVEWDGDAKK